MSVWAECSGEVDRGDWSGPPADRRYVLGTRVDVTDIEDCCARMLAWARAGDSRYCCVSTVHMIMEAYDDADFQSILQNADLVHPDGMPLVWMQKLLGAPHPGRVTGTDLSLLVCRRAAEAGVPVGFYGATEETLRSLERNLSEKCPGLKIAYSYAPPFRPLTAEEDEQVTREISESGCRILFVGIGCPKQERWMREHRGRVPCVMSGIGAAFDWHAGKGKRAPMWIQKIGMEWFHRLLSEPRRLWKRYLTTNPRFLVLAAGQLTGLRRFGRGDLDSER